MIILQGIAEPFIITQGFSAAPKPSVGRASGGMAAGGTTTPLARFDSITYRYLGGRSGQPEPACMSAGPILVRYFDEDGRNLVDVMERIDQPIPPDGTPPSDEGSIDWAQIVAWCPLSELDL